MIEFEGVGHAYGERVVLRDVNLTLRERFVGVAGANGSGKSTLARCVNALVAPTSGRVLVDGVDAAREPSRVRRRVGFVFPDPSAQIVMPTPAEDIAFSLRRAKLGKVETARRVDATLERFGLAGHRDHPAGLLSSGQRQLLALASVLVTEPDVLVCDEPTTLLDLRHTRRVAALLHGLDQQVLLVTHDLDLLVDLERVLVVDEGRVVADAPGAQAVPFYRDLMRDDAGAPLLADGRAGEGHGRGGSGGGGGDAGAAPSPAAGNATETATENATENASAGASKNADPDVEGEGGRAC